MPYEIQALDPRMLVADGWEASKSKQHGKWILRGISKCDDDDYER